MKKSEEEQNIFLSICSAYDRAVLTGKEEMKKEEKNGGNEERRL